MADELRERFKTYWAVTTTAETVCLRRLITGEEECLCDCSWIDREHESIRESDEPPHKPPHSDYAALYLDDDNSAVYSIHLYHPHLQTVSETAKPDQRQRNGWFDIVRCAEHWGLEIVIMPTSWSNAFSTVNIVFYPPERRCSDTDEV